MRIAICDDEIVQVNLIIDICNKWSKATSELCYIESFQSAEEFLFKYEDNKSYDVLLLDIQMKEINGMDLARKLREIGEQMLIAFITGDRDYVFEGYEVQALDYILKPIVDEKVFKVLDKSKKLMKSEGDHIFIQGEGAIYKLRQSEIIFIESVGHNTVFHLSEKNIICNKGISIIENEVNSEIFYKCHRSYLVNIAKIKSISKKDVEVDNGNIIPIARGKWDGLNKAYLSYYRGIICQ